MKQIPEFHSKHNGNCLKVILSSDNSGTHSGIVAHDNSMAITICQSTMHTNFNTKAFFSVWRTLSRCSSPPLPNSVKIAIASSWFSNNQPKFGEDQQQ